MLAGNCLGCIALLVSLLVSLTFVAASGGIRKDNDAKHQTSKDENTVAGGSFLPRSMVFPAASLLHQKKLLHKETLKKELNSPWHWSAPTIHVANGDTKTGDFAIAGSLLGLSPDGQTLISGFHVAKEVMLGSKERAETIHGIQLHTYTYLDKIREWVPHGVQSVSATQDCASCTAMFKMTMGTHTVAILQTGMNSQWIPDFTEVLVYDYQSRPWVPIGPPIQGMVQSKAAAIRAMDIADEAAYVEAELVVATGLLSVDGTEDGKAVVAVKTPETIYPNDDYDAMPHMKWTTIGRPILGDNFMFGIDVKLSKDGGILAVMGSYDLPTEEEIGNLSCYIRMYEFQNNDWVQMGQDIVLQKDKYTVLCPPITLSGDGNTVMTGYRAFEDGCPFHPIPHGHVRVWSWHPTALEWKRKGPDLDTLFPVPDSPQDFTFGNGENLMSSDGNRVVLTAYENLAMDRSNDDALVYYLATFDWKDGNWTQLKGSTVESTAFAATAMDDAGENIALADLLLAKPTSGAVKTYQYSSPYDHVAEKKWKEQE